MQTESDGRPEKKKEEKALNIKLGKRTNQQNAQINFGLMNLLLLRLSIPQQSHRDVNTYT